MFALLAPGQGAQKPGFLSPWMELPGVPERLRWWSELAGVDLIRLGTEADAEEIADTAKTQPLLVAAGLLAAERLPLSRFTLTAGHSVGELTAAAVAGALSPEAAISLAAARGREMAAACAQQPTGMSALLGGDPDEVAAAIDKAGAYPANRNSPAQVVAAGSIESLETLAQNPPAKTRIAPLSVAGAFHTPYMEPARQALERLAAGVPTSPTSREWLSNADGGDMPAGDAATSRLVEQVTAPVRWDLCMQTMAVRGVRVAVELPPAGTLVGLAKRELKGVTLVKVNTPEDLDAVAAALTDAEDESHSEEQRA